MLAACEFLSETPLTTYQKSLIETQISCGKTLLQVIEQVLDYSKINSFQKVRSKDALPPFLFGVVQPRVPTDRGQPAQDERSPKRHGSDFNSESLASGNKMQNLFEEADVCELCEEVVEGTVAGIAHLSATIGGQLGKSSDPAAGKSVYGFTKNVAVILEFGYQMDWVYVVQPGALRRILMNSASKVGGSARSGLSSPSTNSLR